MLNVFHFPPTRFHVTRVIDFLHAPPLCSNQSILTPWLLAFTVAFSHLYKEETQSRLYEVSVIEEPVMTKATFLSRWCRLPIDEIVEMAHNAEALVNDHH